MFDANWYWSVARWHRFSTSPTTCTRIRDDCPYTNRPHHSSCSRFVGINSRRDSIIRSLQGMTIRDLRKWNRLSADAWPHTDGTHRKSLRSFVGIASPASAIWYNDTMHCRFQWEREWKKKQKLIKKNKLMRCIHKTCFQFNQQQKTRILSWENKENLLLLRQHRMIYVQHQRRHILLSTRNILPISLSQYWYVKRASCPHVCLSQSKRM